MKVYLLKEEDFERLIAAIHQDSRFKSGSVTQNEQEQFAHIEAHRFFNYHVRTWIESVKK